MEHAIKNNCGYSVWPAATPVGGGMQLNTGETCWTVNVPAGTSGGRVWGRTFSGGRGHCASADCGVAESCTLSGQPPLTLVEFTIGGSVIDGYNLAIDFSCSNGMKLHCGGSQCPDAYLYPNDNSKNHPCRGNSDYMVTFCP